MFRKSKLISDKFKEILAYNNYKMRNWRIVKSK